MNALLSLLKSTRLPEINELPTSRDVAKSILLDFGTEHKSILACPTNDCILYYEDYAAMQSFPQYQAPCTIVKILQ